MAEKELLNALSEMMDSKFEALKRDVVLNMATKEDIRNMVTKDDIADLVTKEDLRYAENVILSEVDRVQEKSNMHYHELKEDICQLSREVRSMNVEGLRYRVERLEAIVL